MAFTSPAKDYEEKPLSLDSRYIQRPAATFFAQIDGNGFSADGILNGAIAVIDRSLTPKENDILLCVIEGVQSIRRLEVRNGRRYLSTPNPDFADILAEDNDDVEVWGVVTAVVNEFRSH
ncbi:LexA family protein [Endozoicomonas atrinae]|uniref:LexA family protein n=1 Tax=Endozoicomonas atrinae TaxID=1333660 RepID=UPI003AFFA938